MDNIQEISNEIASHLNIDAVLCRQSVDRVVEYYSPSNYGRTRIAALLKEYILSGDTNRAVRNPIAKG